MGLAVWAHATFGGETSVLELRFSILTIGIWIKTIFCSAKLQTRVLLIFNRLVFFPLAVGASGCLVIFEANTPQIGLDAHDTRINLLPIWCDSYLAPEIGYPLLKKKVRSTVRGSTICSYSATALRFESTRQGLPM
ncbi:hypothetical protein ACN42_g3967 [Penicillium freii]|uniref:Uncharacterized protein n=1 Tax=Penicillium freii TaxID=48697 RepID=A0A117NPY7_PENFR|nr:hypothetical protein ACN42_g3967 [Penicillium freii]